MGAGHSEASSTAASHGLANAMVAGSTPALRRFIEGRINCAVLNAYGSHRSQRMASGDTGPRDHRAMRMRLASANGTVYTTTLLAI